MKTLLALVCVLACGPARADTLAVYDVGGLVAPFGYPPMDSTLTGTLTFDFTTGQIAAYNFSVYNGTILFANFNTTDVNQAYANGTYFVTLDTRTGGLAGNGFKYNYGYLGLQGPFVPGQNTNICSLATLCADANGDVEYSSSIFTVQGNFNQYRGVYSILSGQLTPVSPAVGTAVTPEPSAWVLLGTGCLLLGCVRRLRRPGISAEA